MLVAVALFADDGLANTEISPTQSLDEIVAQSQLALDLARRGLYGPLSTRTIKLARASVQRIEALADGKDSLTELSASDRADFDAARERLDTVLRIENKNRIVCLKRVPLGTRIGRQECMTIGQREERALKARRETNGMQNQIFCAPANAEGVGAKCLGGG
jgi:hypothetical protein